MIGRASHGYPVASHHGDSGGSGSALRGWAGLRSFMMLIAAAMTVSLAVMLLAGTQIDAAPPGPAAQNLPVPATHPVSPEDSLKYLQTDDELLVELAAHEPQVVDPVAIRFDERGRMWVVEMGDYPHGPAAGEQPQSRIRILEDRDGDGRYETATVFADQLLFATGIQPWRNGAFVTLAGTVAYFGDRDGDGRADERETWYTGFTQENSQLRANHPRLGRDGWIYVANGLRGGTIVDARKPERTAVSISGRDFRFHPHTGDFQAVSGVGQFGLAFDDYGQRFVCSNRNPLQHVVIEDEYLRRNPQVAIPAVVQDVARFGEESALFALTRAWTTSNLHAGQFTAACGVKIFTGDRLPESYRGNGFTCDPTANVVHRECLQAAGGSFRSQSPYERREFLASTDEWFRPVNLEAGPDGALYVVDMHRAVIEHPQFMPVELQNRPDLRLGIECGRIYRVVSKSAKAQKFAEVRASADELDADNGWRRDTAFRLLYEEPGRVDLDAVKRIATGGRSPQGRAAAILLLASLGHLDWEMVETKLSDADANVRRWAVRCGERWIGPDVADRESARGRLRTLAEDPDPAVRFQVALSLVPAEQADLAALQKVALTGADDLWTRRAVLMAAGGSSADLAANMFAACEKYPRALTEGEIALMIDLLRAAAAQADADREEKLVNQLLRADGPARAVQVPGLLVMAQAMSRRGRKVGSAVTSDEMRGQWKAISADLERVALQDDASVESRIQAVELLAYEVEQAGMLGRIALADAPASLRSAAINGWGRHATTDRWQQVLQRFRSESPALRRVIIDQTLTNPERTAALLDQISAGAITASELDRTQADRLSKHPDEAIRKRVATLIGSSVSADRAKVLADYQPVLKLAGDPRRGREVFAKQCASCHRVGDLGVNVAPDISDSRVKSSAQILTDILQPNRAIDNNYIGYVVVTNDGQSLSGVLSAETANSVTLKQAEGKTATLLRSEIETLRSTGVSLMPEGLEKNIPPESMADLVSFIKNWRYLDGKTPLGGNVDVGQVSP